MTSFVCFVVVLVAVSMELTHAECPEGNVRSGPCDEGGVCTPPSTANVNDDETCDCCEASTTAKPTTTKPTTTKPKKCVDRLGECSIKRALCNQALYKTFMTKNCPKSCNRCSSSG